MAAHQQVSHTRMLTVGETFQRRIRGETGVPFIRLSGKWLVDAGFRVGDSIRVSVVKDRYLVITSRIMDVNHQKMDGLELN
jgi:hypothetical protein